MREWCLTNHLSRLNIHSSEAHPSICVSLILQLNYGLPAIVSTDPYLLIPFIFFIPLISDGEEKEGFKPLNC